MGKRCWLEVTFESPLDRWGRQKCVTKRLIADLGCWFELVVDERTLRQLRWGDWPGQDSNYGWLNGGRVRVSMPDLEFKGMLPMYANPRVARMLRQEGFDGIAGKPFLDQFHWSNGTGGQLCLESWSQFHERYQE